MKLEPHRSRVKKQPQVDDIRYPHLLEATRVIPWEADAKTLVFTYVGPQAKALLGYPLEQWYEKDFWQSHIHCEDRDFAINFCETSSKSLSDYELDYRMLTADGRVVWLHDVVNVVTENGMPRLLRGFMIDISDRKRAEEALREGQEKLGARVEERTLELRMSESRLNEAQRMAKIGNWERNLVTNELWWSQERYRIVGRASETFRPTQESFLQTVHPEDRQRFLQIIEMALVTGESYSIEYRAVLPDSSIRTIHSHGEVFFDQEGRPVRAAGTAQDITERVELERGIVAAGEHERNRIGRDLHDGLGQELTGISLRLQSLSQKLARESSPHVQAIRDLTAMIQNTIAETRRVARDLAPDFSIELGIDAALRALAEEVNEHSDVRCHAHCSAENEFHDAEIATHFYRIAQESINNALRHSGAQNIELLYGHDGDSLFLEVLDDGTGIPSTESRGQGMGLRSMHYRARMLRGRLEVGLRDQGGTRVFCSCPIQSD